MPNKPRHIYYIRRIDRLLDDEDYEWAKESLKGIKYTIDKTQKVTESQVDAIMNIKRAGY